MTARLLRIEHPRFVAGVVWLRDPDGWRIDPTQCAPILRWMLELDPAGAHRIVANWLRQQGATWQWLDVC